MTPAVSIQLWPARMLDVVQALEMVSRLGYDSIQPYSTLFSADCARFRSLIDNHDLTSPSVHMELHELRGDLARWIDMAHTLGARSITVAHLRPSDPLDSADDWTRLGDDLAETASRLSPQGLRLGWGNHGHEYRSLPDGRRPIDLVLAHDNVDYELVLGWLAVMNQDIEMEFERYADRIKVLRLRDYTSRDPVRWTSIGHGNLGYDKLGRAMSRLHKLGQLVVDGDLPLDFLAFSEQSLPAAKRLSKLAAGNG